MSRGSLVLTTALATIVALCLITALGAALVVYAGLYDVSATNQHLRPTYHLLDVAMRRAIGQRAAGIAVPEVSREERSRGAELFEAHCVQCHGAPGVAPEPFALGLRPIAANLAHTGREWKAEDIFWVIKNGIKMTGMPAWDFRLRDAEIWSIVAFIRELPRLSPADYRALASAMPAQRHGDGRAPPAAARRPDSERGRRALHQYACATCHHIPGVVGPNAPVGPPLEGMGRRAFIAGVLKNEPQQMLRWLRHPQEVSPASAMPDLGVSEQDAIDMAAYLATLK